MNINKIENSLPKLFRSYKEVEKFQFPLQTELSFFVKKLTIQQIQKQINEYFNKIIHKRRKITYSIQKYQTVDEVLNKKYYFLEIQFTCCRQRFPKPFLRFRSENGYEFIIVNKALIDHEHNQEQVEQDSHFFFKEDDLDVYVVKNNKKDVEIVKEQEGQRCGLLKRKKIKQKQIISLVSSDENEEYINQKIQEIKKQNQNTGQKQKKNQQKINLQLDQQKMKGFLKQHNHKSTQSMIRYIFPQIDGQFVKQIEPVMRQNRSEQNGKSLLDQKPQQILRNEQTIDLKDILRIKEEQNKSQQQQQQEKQSQLSSLSYEYFQPFEMGKQDKNDKQMTKRNNLNFMQVQHQLKVIKQKELKVQEQKTKQAKQNQIKQQIVSLNKEKQSLNKEKQQQIIYQNRRATRSQDIKHNNRQRKANNDQSQIQMIEQQLVEFYFPLDQEINDIKEVSGKNSLRKHLQDLALQRGLQNLIKINICDESYRRNNSKAFKVYFRCCYSGGGLRKAFLMYQRTNNLKYMLQSGYLNKHTHLVKDDKVISSSNRNKRKYSSKLDSISEQYSIVNNEQAFIKKSHKYINAQQIPKDKQYIIQINKQKSNISPDKKLIQKNSIELPYNQIFFNQKHQKFVQRKEKTNDLDMNKNTQKMKKMNVIPQQTNIITDQFDYPPQQSLSKVQRISSKAFFSSTLNNYSKNPIYKGKTKYRTRQYQTISNGNILYHISVQFICCPKNHKPNPFLHYISSNNKSFKLIECQTHHVHQKIPKIKNYIQTLPIIVPQNKISKDKPPVKSFQKQNNQQSKKQISDSPIPIPNKNPLNIKKIKQKQTETEIQIHKSKNIKKERPNSLHFDFPLQSQLKELKKIKFKTMQQIKKLLLKLRHNKNHGHKNIKLLYNKQQTTIKKTLYAYFPCCGTPFSKGPHLYFQNFNGQTFTLSSNTRIRHFHISKIANNNNKSQTPHNMSQSQEYQQKQFVKSYQTKQKKQQIKHKFTKILQPNNSQQSQTNKQTKKQTAKITTSQITAKANKKNKTKTQFCFPYQQELINLRQFNSIQQVREKYRELSLQKHHKSKNIKLRFQSRENNNGKYFTVYYLCCKGTEDCPRICYKSENQSPYEMLNTYRLKHYHFNQIDQISDSIQIYKLKQAMNTNTRIDNNLKTVIHNTQILDKQNKVQIKIKQGDLHKTVKQDLSQSNKIGFQNRKLITKRKGRKGRKGRRKGRKASNHNIINPIRSIEPSITLKMVPQVNITPFLLNKTIKNHFHNEIIEQRDQQSSILSFLENQNQGYSIQKIKQNLNPIVNDKYCENLTVDETITFYKIFKIDKEIQKAVQNFKTAKINFQNIYQNIQNNQIYTKSYLKYSTNPQDPLYIACIEKLITSNDFVSFQLDSEVSLDKLNNKQFSNTLFVKKVNQKSFDHYENYHKCIYLSVFTVKLNNRKDQLILTLAYTLTSQFKQEILWFSLTQMTYKIFKSFQQCLQNTDNHEYLYKALKKSLDFFKRKHIKFIFTNLNIQLLNQFEKLQSQCINKNIQIIFSIHILAFKDLLNTYNEYSNTEVFRKISQKIKNHQNKQKIGQSYKYLKDLTQRNNKSNQRVNFGQILSNFNMFNSIFTQSRIQKSKLDGSDKGIQFLELSFFSFNLQNQSNQQNVEDPVEKISNIFKFVQNINNPYQIIISVLSYFNCKSQRFNEQIQLHNTIIPSNLIWIQRQVNYLIKNNQINHTNDFQASEFYDLISTPSFQFQLIVQNCPRIVIQMIYQLIRSSSSLEPLQQKRLKDKNKNQQQFILFINNDKQNIKVYHQDKYPLTHQNKSYLNNNIQKELIKMKKWKCQCNFYQFTGVPCQHELYSAIKNKHSIFNEISSRWKLIQ